MASSPQYQLSAQDLLAGSGIIHSVGVPQRILVAGATGNGDSAGIVRVRPLSVGVLALISRAARDDEGLVPLLMIKEAVVDPSLTLDQIRQMHIGLVHFLIRHINIVSGLSPDGEAIDTAANSPLGASHLLLAKHFGWTPEQVSQLTPAQVAVYIKGIQTLMNSAGKVEVAE